LQLVPKCLGGLHINHVTKDVLGHGRKEVTDNLLILIIPRLISRVRDQVGAISSRRGKLLGQSRKSAVKVTDQSSVLKIGQELSTPDEEVVLRETNGHNMVDRNWG
jgi:hypothetical protein